MREPEEVARDAYAAAEHTYDALREFGPKMSHGEVRERMIYAIATHLRARDAEVRAEALAGFTEERKDICDNCGRSPCYAKCRHRIPNPQRRLVGPWEPEP